MRAMQVRAGIGHPMGTRAAFVVSLALSAALAGGGCAGASPTLDRWLGRTPAPPAASGHGNVYYSAVDGLKVYSGPSRSSALVGALPRHARVVRAKLEG